MAKQIWKALDNLSPSNIKLKDLPRKLSGLHNLKVNLYGQLVKRAGCSKYNTTSLGDSHKILGMHRYYTQANLKEFLVAWNTKIYKLSETTPWAGTALYSTGTTDFTVTADKDTYFCDFLNTCYFVNGTDGVFKYDRTFARIMGIIAPTVKCAGTSAGSSGYLGAGDYKYMYTWVDEDGYESNPSPTSDAITATALATISLTDVANSSDPKIASKNIYRTSVGGAIYYYEGEIADNTTTTFSSTIADSSLGTEVKTNHTAPPTTSHLITKRRNKLYLAYNDYLYPSHTSDVEYFPPLWRIRTGNSQKIKGLLEQLTALPVTTEDSIERLVGTGEDNFEFKNSYSTEGCVAIRSYVNCDNLIIYLGHNGINFFDGTTSGIFSEAVNKYIRDNIVDAYRHLSCATYFDNKYILCYPKTGGTYPTETIWIDLKNKSYGVYSFSFSCFSIWDRGTDGLKLKGGSNTIGQVYSVFDGLDDDGSAITAYDDIEPLDMGTPEKYKQWYSVFIKIKSTTATQLTMYYTLDGGTETSANKVMNGTDIAFVDGGAGADTITTVAGSFLSEGFKAEDIITVSGSDSNNKNFTIVSLTATTITLATGQVTAEAAGVAVLTAPLTLEADTTKWYRVSLGSGGKVARTFKPRPYISDKYAFTIEGYMICYEDEAFAEEKE